MNLTCRLIFVVAIAATAVSCEKKPAAADSTDDAKLRPELAAARKGASPTPALDEARTNPTPTP
jgi:hypothetical protein